jgi:diguanylate cyclase (GGDEF)-like protein/PAS domain S-box-containing protein
MNWLPTLRPGKLALKLASHVILFSSVIALVITAVELLSDYMRDLRQIDERMAQIETAYLDSLNENLWVADKERLKTQLLGIVRQPDFAVAEILVDGKTLLKEGNASKKADLKRRFDLTYSHRGKLQTIGELEVTASYEDANLRVLKRLLFTLLANGTKTFLVALFIFFVFYRLLGRHIERIADYAREHSTMQDGPPLVLSRSKPEHDDELSVLVDSTNHLRDELVKVGKEQRVRADMLERQAMQLNQELHARKTAEQSLHLMASVFESSQEAILISDADNHIVAVNPAFCQLTGYAKEEVIGKNPKILWTERTDPKLYSQMWEGLHTQGFWQGEIWSRRKDGEVYPKWISITVVRNPDQQVVNYIAIFTDITARKESERQIYQLAHRDTLTGMANRLAFNQTLIRDLDLARRDQSVLALAFIDLDRFKDINDIFGHDVGDQLLIQAADRLKDSVRDTDLVARLGGDEFVVILSPVIDAASATQVAEKIRQALDQPYHIDGRALRSTPSIGMAFYPGDGTTGDVLMKKADTAMYHAKALGRNNVQLYAQGMEEATRQRIEIEHELRVALDAGQFELHYQPQFDRATSRCVGVEALIRWRHPLRGLVPPLQFIAIAEQSGIIVPLGEWVLNEACRQLRAWRELGLLDLTMSVNLSSQQLAHSLLLEFIEKTLALHDLPCTCLELEITESMLMEDIDASIDKLKAIKKMGVRLAIDDFGTGYSSLSYLKQLPIDTLKLDRSFVKDIETDPSDVAICKSTITLAHNLELKVVAEGVETQGQRDFLALHHCDIFQGYLFSKPLPAEQLFDLLASKQAV